MPVIYQYRIYRQDLQRNPDVLYVFGDNGLRIGMGGQAAHMRGEPNAVGVATKRSPSMSEEAFFSDDDFRDLQEVIAKDLLPLATHLRNGGTVIWPLEGIGTGLSEMPQRAPKTWEYLEKCRKHLETI